LIKVIEEHDMDMLGLKGYDMVWGQPKLEKEPEIIRQVDYVLVDGAIVKGAVVKELGVIGKHFFMMCEDYDYCLRLTKAGKKIGVYNAQYERLHMGSEKFSKGTLWRGYYHAKNHLLILKEYPSFERLIGYILRQTKYLIAALIYAPDRWRRISFRLQGIWDGLLGRKGKTIDPINLKWP
jgi:GT2 family glycosyltransferase